MSLIYPIKYRRLEDLANDGYRVIVTGSATTGATTIHTVGADRALLISGYSFSTNSDTVITVALSLYGNSQNIEFFKAYISKYTYIEKEYSLGNWMQGDLGYSLVLTTTGAIDYSVDCRRVSWPTPLRYVEHDGSAGHSTPQGQQAVFPDASGYTRGQSVI